MTSTTPAFQPFLPSTLPVREVMASGTNLFTLAAQYLGDATQWYRIAELNKVACTNPATGLIDPWITTLVTLLIPPAGPSNGGIFSP